eukprot:2977743-Prymnesium_polylepis.1
MLCLWGAFSRTRAQTPLTPAPARRGAGVISIWSVGSERGCLPGPGAALRAPRLRRAFCTTAFRPRFSVQPLRLTHGSASRRRGGIG